MIERAEALRLEEDARRTRNWKRWGPYLAERQCGTARPEYELIDTGVFEGDRFFDVFVEYAKAAPGDLLIRITVANRAPVAARLHLLPTLWFRNTWDWGRRGDAAQGARPRLAQT